jgi:hypothetical protein
LKTRMVSADMCLPGWQSRPDSNRRFRLERPAS